MKLRRMMVIVAALAVLTWLATPAVRIWRDPTLLKHSHTFNSELDEGPMSIDLKGNRMIQADHIVITHDSSFGKVYRQLLLNPRPSAPPACPDPPKVVRSSKVH